MARRPKKQRKTKAVPGHWIDDENRQYEARKLVTRIKETALKAQNEFWEIVIGSFPEIVNEQAPDKMASDFTKACGEAVTNWYIANGKLDETIVRIIKSGSVKPHEKKVLIGQNDEGWWAANPEPAFKHQDIEKIEVLIKSVPTREQLIAKLIDLGFKTYNIHEGILNLK